MQMSMKNEEKIHNKLCLPDELERDLHFLINQQARSLFKSKFTLGDRDDSLVSVLSMASNDKKVDWEHLCKRNDLHRTVGEFESMFSVDLNSIPDELDESAKSEWWMKQGSGTELLTLCIDGPDCSGKTSLLSLMEKVDLSRLAGDRDSSGLSASERRSRFSAGFSALCKRNDRGDTEVLKSLLTTYPHSTMAEAVNVNIKMPLCTAWQHPSSSVSKTGKTIREWLRTQDALSGEGVLPPVSVQAAFTQSWVELMTHIRLKTLQGWVSGKREEREIYGMAVHHSDVSPVHLIDRSVVSMVVYGLLGGVSPDMLEALSKFYAPVPILILSPSLSTIGERICRGDDAMEKAEEKKYGMVHATASLYAWLKQRQADWLLDSVGETQEEAVRLYLKVFGQQVGRIGMWPTTNDSVILQSWRSGIEAELTGDGQAIWSMVELMSTWMDIHTAYYLANWHTMPSPTAEQFLFWAFEWTLTWPGQWHEDVQKWFRPIQQNVLAWFKANPK